MANRRTIACLTISAALLLFGCTDSEPSSTSDTSGGSETTKPSATGPSPGVTDDTIKIGVTYVDTKALEAVNLDYDLGDHKAVYEALIDDVNADGGINGRQLELVFAPIDPTSPAPAEAACLKLTEDEDVFALTGFFLGDAVKCPLDTHTTAVVGGGMTPERLEAAKAPWVTWTPDTDQPEQVLRTLAEQGTLDGKVAVFAAVADQAQLEDTVEPVLDELGIEPVETGIVNAPVDDTVALQNDVRTISQRFQAADADTILIIGNGGAIWPQYTADDPSYRPKLRFLDITAARAFATSGATTDTSVLEGSLSGGGYGPDQARFETDSMQDCIGILDEAGIDTPSPEEVGDDPSNQPYQAAFQACPDVVLLRALLDAAGKNLNYGTLAAAIEGLKVTIPGEPSPRTYGPPPEADGQPTPYLFAWNEGAKNFELQES